MEVRKLRKDSAQAELGGCMSELQAAKAERIAKESDLEEYVKWRNGQSEDFFQRISETGHRAVEIGQGLAGLKALESKDADFQQRIREAQKAEDRAQAAYEKAQQSYNEAAQEIKKLEEHRSRWEKQEKVRLERIEENELDDFKTGLHPDSILAATEE